MISTGKPVDELGKSLRFTELHYNKVASCEISFYHFALSHINQEQNVMKTKLVHLREGLMKNLRLVLLLSLLMGLSLACGQRSPGNIVTLAPATPVPVDLISPTEPPTSLPPSPVPPTLPPSTPTTAPTATDTQVPPSPTLEPTNLPVDPLSPVGLSSGLPEEGLADLFVSAGGDLLVAGEAGLFRLDGDNFTSMEQIPLKGILGEIAGRLWLLSPSGDASLTYDSSGLWTYGEPLGWQPIGERNFPFNHSGDGFAIASDGGVWVAYNGPELNNFDPVSGLWSSLSAVDIGFDPPETDDYQGHYLTDVLLSQAGSLWVSDCIGEGEGYAGQGARYYKDGVWNPIIDTTDQCIFDLEMDSSGKVYAGGFDLLMSYDPATGLWDRLLLPEWPRRQIIHSIDLDPQGRPWLEVIRCGGASCDSSAYFYLDGDTWVQYLDPGENAPLDQFSLAFTSQGEAWFCYAGNLYTSQGGLAEEIAQLKGSLDCQVAVDGLDRVWVLAGGRLSRVAEP